MAVRPAVFLDKDGTLLENVPFNVEPDLMRFLPGVAEGLRYLDEAGYRLVVVSNQAGVSHGYFPEEDLEDVEDRLGSMFEAAGAKLSGFYYCPHHPQGIMPDFSVSCLCRKPGPGMLFQAARELDIDVSHSWMIGDILDDMEAGKRAGCRTILVNNGNETEWKLSGRRIPDFVASDFLEAVRVIAREAGILVHDVEPAETAPGTRRWP